MITEPNTSRDTNSAAKNEPLVSIVIPTFNEEQNVEVIGHALSELFEATHYRYELIFVDDGSLDNSVKSIKNLATELPDKVFYISFSRNFGHQSAVKAGYEYAQGECVIAMDCDMQHPPKVVVEMLELWEQGYEVVYTRRKEDERLSWFKRFSSKSFYKVLNMISDVELENGVADFRLLDRRVVDAINVCTESEPFLRGLVKWVGFNQIGIDYTPDERLNGKSKYTVRKMLALAVRGITSFSTKPLYAAIYLGLTIAILCVLYLPYVIYSVTADHASAGWSSLILTVAFLGSIQIVILGILGLYIGKLVKQTKHRPEFIVARTNIEQRDGGSR